MRKCAQLTIRVLALSLVCAAGVTVLAQAQQHSEHVIIDTPKPYMNVVSAIENLGGKVKRQFQYIDAISADIPSSALPALRDLVGENAIAKDSIIPLPRPAMTMHKKVSNVQFSDIYTSIPIGANASSIFPAKPPFKVPSEKAYAINEANINIQGLHAAGYTGKGIVVAVIDSGTKPGYLSLDAGKSVINGEDFAGDCPGGSKPGPFDGDNCPFSSSSNDPHGTFVAALISGNARFPVPATSATFLQSMKSNFPGSLESNEGTTYVDMIGSAPESQIFAVRVFGANTGTTKSTVIAAMESVITQRRNFDKHGEWSMRNTQGGFNIKVCNLSLGTSTTDAGHTELEQLVDTMIANDIVPIIAAGDAGPSSLTISSPATSLSALAVGATSPAANERLLNDVSPPSECTGPCGALERPTGYTQTAYFSSRGPTADGRILPNVMAAGFALLSQGCGLDASGNCTNVNSLDIASGTSFSAPVVSGVAAVLRQKFPNASAGQIWNAIVNSANNKELGDNSTVLDQGQGVIDAAAAADLIQSNKVSDHLPAPPRKPDSLVSNNIEANTDLTVVSGSVKQQFHNLRAGERSEILYKVDPTTSQVIINLTNVKFAGKQNAIFGDDVFLNIQSAKTSSSGFGDYFPCQPFFVFGDTSIVIPDPSCPFPEVLEPGVMRITLMGDSINAGNVSADVSVTSSKDSLPRTTASGKIRGGDNLFFSIDIPAGVSMAEFNLRWDQDWGHYPTSDLDMYLYDPNNGINGSGATLNSPEDVIVNNPIPGTWKVLVQGFAVATKTDNFILSVLSDGKPVKIIKNGQ